MCVRFVFVVCGSRCAGRVTAFVSHECVESTSEAKFSGLQEAAAEGEGEEERAVADEGEAPVREGGLAAAESQPVLQLREREVENEKKWVNMKGLWSRKRRNRNSERENM